MKATRHRQEVLRVLLENPNTPMSVDELVNCLQDNFDRVTAYRILNCFADAGLAERVTHHSNTLRFTLAPNQTNKHQHLITCRLCGSTMTARICVQPSWQEKLARLGFTDVSHNLSFTGICSEH